MFFVKLQQNRHPEQSASRLDRVNSACSAESKDLGGAQFPMLLGAFQPPARHGFSLWPRTKHDQSQVQRPCTNREMMIAVNEKMYP
jgi:hypothetical protein